MTPSERFWSNVQGGDVETCWLWTGKLIRGYGRFTPAYRMGTGAHRFAYADLVGEIPAGLDVDHLCRNRACVNPWHLEPVSRSENLRRGYEARGPKPTCKHGHDFTEANTYPRPGGHRGCRTCRLEYMRAYKAARKQAASVALLSPIKENAA